MEKKHDYYSSSQNEDFSTLEQVVSTSYGQSISFFTPIV
jgi:hypothetical protein